MGAVHVERMQFFSFLAFFNPLPPPCTQKDIIVTKYGYLLCTLLRNPPPPSVRAHYMDGPMLYHNQYFGWHQFLLAQHIILILDFPP